MPTVGGVPQGWTLAVGTAGTDINRNESIVQTGAYSMHFLSTAVATEVWSGFIPFFGGTSEYVTALVRADSIAGGNTITLEVYEYDRDRVTSAANATLFSGVLSAADTWEFIGGRYRSSTSSTKFLQIRISKAASAFNVYTDAIWSERIQPSWAAEFLGTPAALSVPTSTWTTVTWNSDMSPADGNGLRGAFVATPSTGLFMVRAAGSYSISSTVEFEALSDAKQARIRLKIAGTNTRYRYGTWVHSSHSGQVAVHFSTANEALEPGDVVSIEVWHDEGSAVNVPANPSAPNTDSYSFFTGSRHGKF